jgi:hypothetical protein
MRVSGRLHLVQHVFEDTQHGGCFHALLPPGGNFHAAKVVIGGIGFDSIIFHILHMLFLQNLHGHMRWLVVLVAVVHLVVLVLAIARPMAPKLRKITGAAFAGLLDLQLLTGLIYLVMRLIDGPALSHHTYEHLTTMLIAVVLMHLAVRWGKKEGGVELKKALLATVVSIGLVVLGVVRLLNGWV